MELQGKIALVTGAARRVGKAIALALARAGCDVGVHCNRSASEAAEAVAEIRSAGRRAEVFRADLAEPGQIASMFQAVKTTFGRLDVLVNSAAVFQRTGIGSLDIADWDRQMAVNVRAPALCIRHALPLMPAGGAIINVGDVQADKPAAAYAAYAASKAALISLTKSCAKALGRRNIRVNAVSPGIAAWQEGATEQAKRAILQHIPMARIGTCEDVAAAVVFLACADYVTGQNLRVDGGWCTD